MKFQKGTLAYLAEIMPIIAAAQEYFRANKIDQWQNGYPNEETIRADIEMGNSYVLCKDGKVVGTAALVFGGEPNYKKIYEGNWISSEEYGALHRIAIRNEFKGKGLAELIIKEMEKICLERGIFSLRVDTHQDNLSMQKMLNKNGFQYCGIIFVADGSPRLAFEKVLKQ